MAINLENEFYCTQCGNRQLFNIPRVKGKERPAGHLKRMFCFTCNAEHNFVECRPYSHYCYSDFLLERKHKNFNSDGTRKIEYSQLKVKLLNKGVDIHEFEE